MARHRHAALGDGDRGRGDRRGADGSAPGRRDAVRRLHLLRLGPPRDRRGQAVLPRANARADRRPPAVGRRLLGRAVPLQNRELVRAHPGPQDRLPGDTARREGPARDVDRGPNPFLSHFEHKHLYRRIKGEVPEERYDPVRPGARAPRRRRRRRRDVGRDGARPPTRRPASRARFGRGPRPANAGPWDKARVLESVKRCSKVLVLRGHAHGGFGGEIAARRSPRRRSRTSDAPVMRIAAPDTPSRSRPRSRRPSSRRSRTSPALRELAAY